MSPVTPRKPSCILLGLDGADMSVINAMGAQQLPALHKLMQGGAYARMQTHVPYATLPNWTTVLTGCSPGEHGVFDFTTRRGYQVSFDAPHRRAVPTLFSRLDQQGVRCTVVGFPGTWPPEPLAHGVFISGWDSPVAWQADASFVWPQSLYPELATFDAFGFDTTNQFRADERWTETLADALEQRIRRKTRLALHLLRQHPCEVFAFYFGESDTAAHYLWSLHDAHSPRRPSFVSDHAQQSLQRVYRALDAAIEEILAWASHPALELTVVSDHGSGGSSDKVLYLNRVLADAGLLHFKRTAPRTLAPAVKDLALRALAPAMRERVFRALGARLPGALETQVRYGAIDMSRTQVFSDELNYFPSLHFNLQGRDPRGIVAPRDVPALLAEVRHVLANLRDPWTAMPVVKHVHTREEVYHGPYVHRAPDVIVELFLDQNYSYNLMPTSAAPCGTGAWRRLSPDEYLGRKGKSLAGSHRARGIWIAHGPGVQPVGEVSMHIDDVARDLLARWARTTGHDAHSSAHEDGLQPFPHAPITSRTQHAPTFGVAAVEERLRALGYVD
jgi:predicted AlkP superfamily phosphohydrolase/phosphomutase